MTKMNGTKEPSQQSGPWITGLGHQYPPYLVGPELFEELATKFYDAETPQMKKLFQINRASGVEKRAWTVDIGSGSTFIQRPELPTITDLNVFWRKAGVDLAAQACRKALKEWGGDLTDITHLVCCTTTAYGNPGIDLHVARKLGLRPEVQRALLAGVGCSGGLAIMRVAAQMACGATARGKPARILAFACEICTPNARHELADVEATADPSQIGIAGTIFGDGAAAFVLCNDEGLDPDSEREPLFQVYDWDNATLPDTMDQMGWELCPTGYRTTLTRDVPISTAGAIGPMFHSLLPSFREKAGFPQATAADLDWCLHPGGKAIIEGVQKSMDLTDAQLAASKQIYRTRGNSSSPTVLIVLDTIRKSESKENIVAASFGPGLSIEMAFLRRC